jgi:hypothetical protein
MVKLEYIEFQDDVFFMESLAQSSFRNGKVTYVPVQRYVKGVKESHIYSISLDSDRAKDVAGSVSAPDGSKDITIFGSALSDDGILYMFNCNSIS